LQFNDHGGVFIDIANQAIKENILDLSVDSKKLDRIVHSFHHA
jgi:hypothetical protein